MDIVSGANRNVAGGFIAGFLGCVDMSHGSIVALDEEKMIYGNKQEIGLVMPVKGRWHYEICTVELKA